MTGPPNVPAAWLAGQVIVGAWVSLTVTVKVQLPVRLAASVAVQVTVVTPLAKVEPEAGEQLTVAPEQLSLAVGVVYVTVAEHWPEAVFVVMFAGHVTVGAWLSTTVTVNVQLPVRFDASVAVQVTVVTPLAKLLPEAGEQETVAPEQLSVAVGVV